jgi:hypothetical protein
VASWRWSGGEQRHENYKENNRWRENTQIREIRGLECPILDSKGGNRTRQIHEEGQKDLIVNARNDECWGIQEKPATIETSGLTKFMK